MRLFSKKFSEIIYKKGYDLILTSPYKDNDIIILININGDDISHEIFKFIYDPEESEIRYYRTIIKGQEFLTKLQLKVIVDLVLPGIRRNELIIISTYGEIWNAYLKNNELIIYEKIGKIWYDIQEEIMDFFDIYNSIDIVPYFNNNTMDFICLVIKENNKFILALNIDFFTNIKEKNSLIEFKDSIAFWNSNNNGLNLFSFNSNKKLTYIYFPSNKKNREIPFLIINLKEFDETPKEACIIDNTIYLLTSNELLIFYNFKKYKNIRSISLPFLPIISWFEPQYKRCKLINSKFQIFDFVLGPFISEKIDYVKINTKTIKNQIFQKKDNLKIKTIGTKHLAIIFTNSTFYLLVKKEHVSSLRTHDLILKRLENPIPDALQSLKKLEELKLFDLEQLKTATESLLPRRLLQIKRRKRRIFLKEEDLFIIQHAYYDLSFTEIGKELNRSPISIYTHLKNIFGTPSCNKHFNYDKDCNKCEQERFNWVNLSKNLINQKSYPLLKIEKEELTEFNFEEWIKKEKLRRLNKKLLFFKDFLSEELFDNIIKFIIDLDILKGRSINTIFEQCTQIFLDDYLGSFLNDARINDIISIPDILLELYFRIRKKINILQKIKPHYISNVNSKYSPLGDLNFFFKDILGLKKLYNEDICSKIIPHLYEFYRFLLNEKIKDGILASLIYLFLKDKEIRITQAKLCECFSITEVTLRKRVKEMDTLISNNREYQTIYKNIEKILSLTTPMIL
ncbi:MAG: hypothetical protein ACTSVV_13880, partial [Promethearchaeota archaeon]